MSDWQPTPKPVIPELEPEFAHAVYPPARIHFPPLLERLDHATVRQLMEMAHGKAPDPE